MQKTLKTLEESCNYYKNLYNTSPIGYVSLDSNGLIREINQTGAKLLGVEQNKLTNTSFLDFVTAETSDIFLNHLKQCEHSIEQVISEIIISAKGHHRTTLQLISIKNKDENGCTIYRTAIVNTSGGLQQSISGRDKPFVDYENATTEALAKENKRLREELSGHLRAEEDLRKLSRAIEQSPCTVVITNAKGIIEYVNPKFTQLTGYAPEEVVGKNPNILKPDNILAEEFDHLWKTITSGKEWQGKFRNKKKNGDLYWEYAYISPVKNQSDSITHFIAVKEDITERLKAEEELSKFSRAIEQSPVITIITNSRGIIEYVNPRFTESSGYTAKEVIGKNPRVLKPENISSEEFAELWKTLLSGKELNGEFCCKKKNGEMYWENVYLSPIRNHEGKITHFIIVKEDITERKLMEEERIRHIKELEDLMSFSTIINEEDVQEEALFKHLVSALQKNFAPDIAAAIMLDKEKNMLYLPVIDPVMPAGELIHKEAILDPSLCKVMNTGKKSIVNDITTESPCECIVTHGKRGGYVCFPIIIGNKTAGMVLMMKKEFSTWKNKKTQRLMSNYTETAALALHKLELLEIAKHTNVMDEFQGIYNKRYFTELLTKQLAVAKRRGENLSLLILGPDNHKATTETYGSNNAGNLLLQQIAGVLSDSVSNSDIIARYDEAEFAIIMPATFTTRALVKADGIRQRVEYTGFHDPASGNQVNITISIGISSFPEHASEVEPLVTLANKAFYKAKNDGGNRVEAIVTSR